MSRRYLFVAVVFVLWITGFYLATGGITGEDLINKISQIAPGSVLLGIGSYLLAVGAGVYTLYRCLKYVGVKPPFFGTMKAWLFGSFIDNIAPTVTPVGEASMAYFLEKFYRISYTKSLAAIGMYVSSWGISVSLFATVAVILAEYYVGLGEFLIPAIIVVAVFSLISVGWILLLTKKSLVKRIICKLVVPYNKVYNKVKRKKVTFEPCMVDIEFERSYTSLEIVMKNRRQILISALLLGVPQLAHVLCMYVLLLGFGVEISFFAVLFVHIVASVAGLLSLIPSGLGVHEGAAVWAFGTFGVPAEIGASVEFIYRLIFVWITNLVGGLVGIKEGITDPGKVKV